MRQNAKFALDPRGDTWYNIVKYFLNTDNHERAEKVKTMATKQALAEIRQDLETFVGKRIRLRSYKGRNKVVEREGILERTYPNIFVVKIEEKRTQRRVSFSYTDVLTESVELTVYREDGEFKIAAARD